MGVDGNSSIKAEVSNLISLSRMYRWTKVLLHHFLQVDMKHGLITTSTTISKQSNGIVGSVGNWSQNRPACQ